MPRYYSGLMDAVGEAMKAADRNGGAVSPAHGSCQGREFTLMMPCLSDDTWG